MTQPTPPTRPPTTPARPQGATRRQLVAMGLIQAADQLRRHFTDFYRPYGLAPQQYNVLRILRGAGDGGLPTMEIAARMIEKTPGITRLIDRLESKSLAHRKRDPTDRRQVMVVISAAGLALLDELEGPVRQATESALEMLDAGEVEELGRLLGRIGQAAER